MKFKDNAEAPIIAIDFDETININGTSTYPICGDVRPWAKEVINFMHDLGIRVVIWTSRDVVYNQDDKQIYDHLSMMLKWLDDNDIHYDAINKSVQFAPYPYNSRKVYAHMYVDDRAFGWTGSENGYDKIFLQVLRSFLMRVCNFSKINADFTVMCCELGWKPKDWMKEEVLKWKQ